MATSTRLWLIAPALLALSSAPASAAEARAKNWQAPAGEIRAQALSNVIMARHPELLSVTLHGTPPGATGVYTMFAGSYPDRVGNPDDPDDIDVIVKGITIIDPRWGRTDPVKKFVVQLPLRDRRGANVGLIVFAFKVRPEDRHGEVYYFDAAAGMRDRLSHRIERYADLFAPAG